MAAILTGKSDAVPLSPKSAQPYLTMKLAEELNATVSFTADAGTLSLRVVQPQMAMAAAS
jgi:hypothetical protein